MVIVQTLVLALVPIAVPIPAPRLLLIVLFLLLLLLPKELGLVLCRVVRFNRSARELEALRQS